MHPPTVIVMIAVHLLGIGLLLLYVSRRLPGQGLLLAWALASITFGVAYVGRLGSGLVTPPPSSVWVDGLMVLALLLYLIGVRQILGARHSLRPALVGAAVFTVVDAAVAFGVHAQARFVMLNLTLGVLYTVMGATALRGIARLPKESSLLGSLAIFGTMISALGLLTLVRAGTIAREGSATMYEGWFQALYFGYGSMVAVVLVIVVVWNVFARMSDELQRLARHDPLTGALNRRGLHEALTRHFVPGAAPLTLLAVDIDHFKRVNDEHGHAAGDAALRAVVRALLAHCRPDDIVARLGGEEFLVGHAAGHPDHAWSLAERLRESVAATRVRGRGDGDIRCTVSVGVSTPFDTFERWEHAAGEADHALYAAKANGRNRCERFDPSLLADADGRRQPSTFASVSNASSSIHSTTDRHTRPTTL